MFRADFLLILLLLIAGCSGNKPAEQADTKPVDVEQQIVDALFIAQNMDSARRINYWDFIIHLEPDEQPNRTVVEYLREPDSPLYDPELLDEYLSYLIKKLPDGDVQRERVEYLLEATRKNAPGSTIANLDIVSGDAKSTLHEVISSDCVVLFYDPDCGECAAMINRLDEVGVPVVAVSVTDSVKTLPASWISSRAYSQEQLEELFYLPALPVVYVVDASGKILE